MAGMNIAPGLEPFLVDVDSLSELPGNPRRGDVEAVKRSYERFGQRKPIVARRDGKTTIVVAGNHQLRAAKELGWKQIAVVFADDLTDDEARGYALADNRIGELGTYDSRLLAAALDDLVERNEDLALAAGWSREAIDAMTFDFALDDDLADFAGVGETTPARKEGYEALGVVGISFPIAAADHDEIVRMLFALRKAYGLDTNAETFLKLVRDAYAADNA